MLVRYKESQDPAVSKIRLSTSLTQRVRRRLGRRLVDRDKERYSQPLSKVELFSDDRGAWTDSVVANVSGFDIIQLHWICDFLNYRRFFKDVPKEVPLVWRLSDMNPLTGGCHYAGDCARFENACGCCPMLESQREHDWSRAIWKRKRAALNQLSGERLHIVALNQWMAEQVRRSSLLGRFECSVIPNGVNLEEFRPIQPTVAREALGIPGGHRVVAFVADRVNNVRKGFPLVLEALNSLGARHNLFLLAVGHAPQLLPMSLPFLQARACSITAIPSPDLQCGRRLRDSIPGGQPAQHRLGSHGVRHARSRFQGGRDSRNGRRRQDWPVGSARQCPGTGTSD